MESFFHTLKTELVMHHDYRTRDQARASVFDYLEVFYNRQRRHSSIKYEASIGFRGVHKTPHYRVTERGRINPANTRHWLCRNDLRQGGHSRAAVS